MNRNKKGRETVELASAANEYAVVRSPEAIARVMRLACEGETVPVRERAALWLFQNVGVKVVQTAIVRPLAVVGA